MKSCYYSMAQRSILLGMIESKAYLLLQSWELEFSSGDKICVVCLASGSRWLWRELAVNYGEQTTLFKFGKCYYILKEEPYANKCIVGMQTPANTNHISQSTFSLVS